MTWLGGIFQPAARPSAQLTSWIGTKSTLDDTQNLALLPKASGSTGLKVAHTLLWLRHPHLLRQWLLPLVCWPFGLSDSLAGGYGWYPLPFPKVKNRTPENHLAVSPGLLGPCLKVTGDGIHNP